MKRLSGLDLIAQMAAGISHEIRNPHDDRSRIFAAIKYKGRCLEYHEYFTLMIDEIDRANSIITEFLSMGNTRSTDLQELDLNSIIHDISPLLEVDAYNQNKQLQIRHN